MKTRKEIVIGNIEYHKKQISELSHKEFDYQSKLNKHIYELEKNEKELRSISQFEVILQDKEVFDSYVNKLIDEKSNNFNKVWSCGCLMNANEKKEIKSGNPVFHFCCVSGRTEESRILLDNYKKCEPTPIDNTSIYVTEKQFNDITVKFRGEIISHSGSNGKWELKLKNGLIFKYED